MLDILFFTTWLRQLIYPKAVEQSKSLELYQYYSNLTYDVRTYFSLIFSRYLSNKG